MRPVSDDDLHAYADGFLPPDARARVEAHLADSRGDAERIADYRRINEEICGRYAGVLEEPVPDRLLYAAARRRNGRPWLRVAAAVAWLAVGVAVGSGLGWWRWGPGAEGADTTLANLVRPAVMAHAVYVTEVRHPVEVGRDQQDHLVQWLSNRLGSPLRTPDLSRQGFDLVGGRLLPGSDGPAAQFMYQAAGGERVTVYVKARGRDSGETAFRYQSSAAGTTAIFWVDGPFGWVVAGALPRDRLDAIAHAVYEQIGS